MTRMPEPDRPLEIREPCRKTWESLEGGAERRYCADCSLFVHDAAALTREQALRLVRESGGRVCMRLEYDRQGNAVFRDSERRLARWTLSAAAGLLAACGGRPADPPAAAGRMAASEQGAGGSEGGEVSPETLGGVSAELGDVGLARDPVPPDPAPPDPAPPQEVLRVLGEVSIEPGPPDAEPAGGGD
jgi:hypothetical protein